MASESKPREQFLHADLYGQSQVFLIVRAGQIDQLLQIWSSAKKLLSTFYLHQII